jgi:1-acyl-sn-glycerol-3-phosphate acyltransferase
MEYGRFFSRLRFWSRIFFRDYQSPPPEELPAPAIYVCRHRNMRGPVDTLLWLNAAVHPWVFSVFCERETAYRQYADYTLTRRAGWPKIFARPAARVLSWVVPKLCVSLGAIPVYRSTGRVVTTFRKTLEVLKAGMRVIIYPDVNYADASEQMGALYEGYLVLGSLYHRATGRNLRFIPLRTEKRRITAGQPIVFDGAKPREQETERVAKAIREALA